jgi:hypothetical protein
LSHPHTSVLITCVISTTVISVIRLQSLVQFAASTNPTFDNVPTAYWSVLEAFTGIFCVCMPTLRRFLAHLSPYCFGTTKNDSQYEQYNSPNEVSDGVLRNARVRASVPVSNNSIVKTIDTTFETKMKEDDEIELMQLHGIHLPRS